MENKEDLKKCCCGNDCSEQEHTCPFEVEINGNHTTCTCCEDCVDECTRNI